MQKRMEHAARPCTVSLALSSRILLSFWSGCSAAAARTFFWWSTDDASVAPSGFQITQHATVTSPVCRRWADEGSGRPGISS